MEKLWENIKAHYNYSYNMHYIDKYKMGKHLLNNPSH